MCVWCDHTAVNIFFHTIRRVCRGMHTHISLIQMCKLNYTHRFGCVDVLAVVEQQPHLVEEDLADHSHEGETGQHHQVCRPVERKRNKRNVGGGYVRARYRIIQQQHT